MEETIKKIILGAINAPSGDNSQPWKFQIRSNGFDIINLPNRDNPIFNFKQRGSYVAHGALIQNIKLLAPLYGTEASVMLFPDRQNADKIAAVTLLPNSKYPEDKEGTLDTIKRRLTNRKKFKPGLLTESQKQALLQEASKFSFGKFILLEDREKKNKIAAAASTAERVMLEYRPLQKAFFDMVRWDKKEEAESGYGMLIDALELKPPQKLIFKWFSHWKVAGILRKVGLPAFVAKENTKIYASAAAFGVIFTDNLEDEQFINTGMLLQSIWLKATRLNLSIQPMVGVIYLGQRLSGAGFPKMAENLQELIRNSNCIINDCLSPKPKPEIVMLFRIGLSDEPSARSNKFLPQIT